ncbi:hypothetical protein DFP73DRAFT_620990 [Morchella snyderi]|nr:hypothetical protein DFP73DRAFT_620990 [Morchella snyderi]
MDNSGELIPPPIATSLIFNSPDPLIRPTIALVIPPQQGPTAEKVKKNEEKENIKEELETREELETAEDREIDEEPRVGGIEGTGENEVGEEDKETEEDHRATRDIISTADDEPKPRPLRPAIEAFLRSSANERELDNLKYLEARVRARRVPQTSKKSDDVPGGVGIYGLKETGDPNTSRIMFTKEGAALSTQAGSGHSRDHERGAGRKSLTREKMLALPKKIFTNKDKREDRMRAHEELKMSISSPTELPRPTLHPWHRSTPDVIYERLCFHFKDHCVDVVGSNVIVHKNYKCSITCTSTPVHWLWLAKPTGMFMRLMKGKGRETGVNDPGWSVPIMICKMCKGRVDLDQEPCSAEYGISPASPSGSPV